MGKRILLPAGLCVGLLVPALSGCALKSSVTRMLISDGSYRVSGFVCSEPEEIRSEFGTLLGMGFDLAEPAAPCDEKTWWIFVSVGRESQMKKARRLQDHQRVELVGTLEGTDRRSLVVQQLKIRK